MVLVSKLKRITNWFKLESRLKTVSIRMQNKQVLRKKDFFQSLSTVNNINNQKEYNYDGNSF